MKTLLSVAFVTILVLLVGTCSFQSIEPGHVGVKLYLGKVQAETVGEGLQWRKPFVEEFREVSIRQFTFKDRAECPSSDSQLVNVQFSIMARIDPTKAGKVVNEYSNKGVEDLYDQLIQPVALDGVKPIVVKYRAEEALSKRDEIRNELLSRLKKEVNHLFIIEDLRIADISLSPQLREAIEAKQVKEQEAIAVKYDLNKAQQMAEITVANATAEAEAIRLKGLAIKENPSVVQLDIVKKWDGKSPTTVVVGSGDGGANILLPIKPTE